MPDTDDNNIVSAYAYLTKVHDDLLSQETRTAERANKMAIVIALVFTALSFGAGHLMVVSRNPDRNDGWYLFAVVLALVAGTTLVGAFLAAMVRSRIKDVYLPGTSRLVENLNHPGLRDANHTRFMAILAERIADSIKRNLERETGFDVWCFMLKWFPQIGFVCTALFVTATFVQSMFLLTIDKDVQGNTTIISVPLEKGMHEEDHDTKNNGDNVGQTNDKLTSEDDFLKAIKEDDPHQLRGEQERRKPPKG